MSKGHSSLGFVAALMGITRSDLVGLIKPRRQYNWGAVICVVMHGISWGLGRSLWTCKRRKTMSRRSHQGQWTQGPAASTACQGVLFADKQVPFGSRPLCSLILTAADLPELSPGLESAAVHSLSLTSDARHFWRKCWESCLTSSFFWSDGLWDFPKKQLPLFFPVKLRNLDPAWLHAWMCLFQLSYKSVGPFPSHCIDSPEKRNVSCSFFQQGAFNCRWLFWMYLWKLICWKPNLWNYLILVFDRKYLC